MFILASVLVVSMLFFVAPIAFAETSDSSDSTPIEQASDVPSLPEETPVEAPAPEVEPVLDTPPVVVPEEPSEPEEPIEEATVELALSSFGGSEQNTVTQLDDEEAEKIASLKKLREALEALASSIRDASGPSIIRVTGEGGDETLDGLNPYAYFSESASVSQIIDQINTIRELLKKCGISEGMQISSLPISNASALPDGFYFAGNTLVLNDPTILAQTPDEALDGTFTRTFDLTLQFNTGIYYIDNWLYGKGIGGFANTTFTITLALVPPFSNEGGGVLPPPPPPPTVILPPPPVGGGDPEGPNQGNGNDTDNTDGALTGNRGTNTGANTAGIALLLGPSASSGSGSGSGSVETVVIPENGDGTVPNENDDALEFNPLVNIEDLRIPMASMLINDDGRIIVANAALVALSLILSAVTLILLRRIKQGKLEPGASTVKASKLGMALGVLGSLLGAASALFLMLSEYALSTASSSSFEWTPILVAIALIQVACVIYLLVDYTLASKRVINPRFKIRF